VLLVPACIETVKISPPPLELAEGEARSAIMMLEDAGALTSVDTAWVGEVSSGVVLPPFSVEGDARVRIHVWLYRETIEELRLVPGPHPLTKEESAGCTDLGAEVARLEAIPIAARALVVELENREAGGWIDLVAGERAGLEKLRLERRVRNPCIGFRPHYGTFADTCPIDDGCRRRTVFTAPLDPETILMGRTQTELDATGTRTGHVFDVHRFMQSDLIHRDDSNPGEAAVAIDGELLVLRESGELGCLARDGRECTLDLPPPIPTSTHSYSALARVGSTLYAARDDGRLWRYTDRWSEISVPRSALCNESDACSNTAIGGCDLICRVTLSVRDDELFVVFPYQDAAYRLAGDQLILAELPPFEAAPDVPLAGALIANDRAALGTTHGRVLLEMDDGWKHVLSIGTQPIYAVAELEGGLLIGAEDGGLHQFHPELGACADLQLSFARITDIVPVGDDFVVAGMRRGSELDFAWLERTPEPGDACGIGISSLPD
jgi:hypothetical protein